MNGTFRFLQTHLSEINKKVEQLEKRIKDLEDWKENAGEEIGDLDSRVEDLEELMSWYHSEAKEDKDEGESSKS